MPRLTSVRHRRRHRCASLLALVAAPAMALAEPPAPESRPQQADGLTPPQYPPEAQIPRNLTPEEQEWIRRFPIRVPDEHWMGEDGQRGPLVPEGPIYCPPEYAPMEGIIISWSNWTSGWQNLLRDMTREITAGRPGGGGYGIVTIVVPSVTMQNTVTSVLTTAGADLSKVRFAVRTLDTIWIRDYGPRYIYQGPVRAIVNHTYNRPRPNDNAFPTYFGALRRHGVYNIPLTHGGGNYHLDALARGYATVLIDNENSGLNQQQIIDLWQQFQNVTTTITPAYPSLVDSTQHIDMWMQIIGDNAVVISDFISDGSATQNIARDVANSVAADMAADGYSVYRIPARRVGTTHYTYTNVVMLNGLVLVPQYSNATMQQYNAQVLATWQQALPDWRIVGLNCDAIVTSAGVMHCIIMHVPEHAGGAVPTAFVRAPAGGEMLMPGGSQQIRWTTDDDVGVLNNVEIHLSHNGGLSYDTLIAANQLNMGSLNWTVPNRFIRRGKIRITARDVDDNIGYGESELFRILGSCAADWDGDGAVTSLDISSYLTTWVNDIVNGTLEADFNGCGCINSQQIAAFITAWIDAVQNGCP